MKSEEISLEATETESEAEGDKLIRFGVSMPALLVRQLDEWREKQGYANRSEAVRDLVRQSLVAEEWEQEDPEAESVGVVTLVYQHNVRQVSDQLIEMQHHHHDVAQASLHIHLTHDNCLEVIVLRGKRAEVVHLANHLISAQGVLYGKFVPTTTGERIAV